LERDNLLVQKSLVLPRFERGVARNRKIGEKIENGAKGRGKSTEEVLEGGTKEAESGLSICECNTSVKKKKSRSRRIKVRDQRVKHTLGGGETRGFGKDPECGVLGKSGGGGLLTEEVVLSRKSFRALKKKKGNVGRYKSCENSPLESRPFETRRFRIHRPKVGQTGGNRKTGQFELRGKKNRTDEISRKNQQVSFYRAKKTVTECGFERKGEKMPAEGGELGGFSLGRGKSEVANSKTNTLGKDRFSDEIRVKIPGNFRIRDREREKKTKQAAASQIGKGQKTEAHGLENRDANVGRSASESADKSHHQEKFYKEKGGVGVSRQATQKKQEESARNTGVLHGDLGVKKEE